MLAIASCRALWTEFLRRKPIRRLFPDPPWKKRRICANDCRIASRLQNGPAVGAVDKGPSGECGADAGGVKPDMGAVAAVAGIGRKVGMG